MFCIALALSLVNKKGQAHKSSIPCIGSWFNATCRFIYLLARRNLSTQSPLSAHVAAGELH